MYNRKYDKILVSLKQDTHGFSLGERPTSGSCTIEIKNNKGILRISLKDLKQPKTNIYKLYGISVSKSKSEGIYICDITPDSTGFFEYKREFDPDNFIDTKKTIDEINVFAVICESKNESNIIISPLCGYTYTKINWKSRFTIYDKSEQQNDTIIDLSDYKEITENSQNTIQAAEKTNFTEKTISSTEAVLEKPSKNDIFDDIFSIPASDMFSSITKRFKEEMELLENAGIFTKEDIKKINNNNKTNNIENINNSDKSDNIDKIYEISETPKNSNIEYNIINDNNIDNVFEENKKITLPHSSIEWVMCDFDEHILLPENIILYSKNPFILYCCKKYKHIIIGRNKKKNTYYIGIPDFYDKDYKLKASQIGFREFIKKDKNWGYWIKEIY